ncbi:MAG: hypothetical protein B5M53_02570 [Candidatus Cloacimonas sp. 4484_209]|nr:MAG: hypothetical protein B5M53_02570 [Candidatus Cloacimonas sp. 4484_209]
MAKRSWPESINPSLEKLSLLGRFKRLLKNINSTTILRKQLELGEKGKDLFRKKDNRVKTKENIRISSPNRYYCYLSERPQKIYLDCY